MAGPEEEVDYYAVLNVRNEVKIVFQIETSRKIFDQSCKLYFIAFQLNHNELKAAYRVQTCVHVISYQDPAKMKVRLKKIRPCWHKAKFSLFCKKHFNREPFLVRTTFFARQNFLTVTKVQRYRCRRERLGAYNFLWSVKLLCSLTAILHHEIK